MLHTLIRSIRRVVRRSPDEAQLPPPLEQPEPRTAEELLARLRAFGLREVREVRLTRNRRTMVSAAGRGLRVHEAYLGAGVAVHRAIAEFVLTSRHARGRHEQRARQEAVRRILEFSARIDHGPPPLRALRTHPEDEAIAGQLVEWHRKLNAERFDGELRNVSVRVSRRMRSRLGHYASARDAAPAEIALSRRHVRRHGLAPAVDTLLHEMVHRWQDERGLPLDHGRAFKAKAHLVGIVPRATRVADQACPGGPGDAIFDT